MIHYIKVMKRIMLLLILFINLNFSITQAKKEETLTVDLTKNNFRFFLQNYVVSPKCFYIYIDGFFPNWKKTVIWTLDDVFVIHEGSVYAPVGCKGQVCWSWLVARDITAPFKMKIFSSSIPLTIQDSRKLSESITQTIKESTSLRKSSSALIKTATEYINTNFGFTTEKEKSLTKERSMSQSESRERSVNLNITPLFHQYLAKALSGPIPNNYPYCISGAVDLFWKAYETNRVNDLVQAFVFYKTIKPTDVDFSPKNDFLNKAKFFYHMIDVTKFIKGNFTKTDLELINLMKDNSWAQATLFAKLLEWEEFAGVRKEMDEEIQKHFSTYKLLTEKTTLEISEINKNLASLKYTVDKQLVSENATESQIRDEYLGIREEMVTPKMIKDFETALSKNDPLLSKKLVAQPKLSTGLFFGGILIAMISFGVIFLVIKKKRFFVGFKKNF
ncbi:MAG: hypothetical protein RMJ67_09180 [Elusimicrobiota bacterium]|nr:hypothetical protein [Endomicrobiia bacterium]MDW8166668.1 hypothetical protein [Elusimicrobiota bacterium]